MVTKEEIDEYILAYNQGNPKIDDATYDALLEEYLKYNGENNRPYTRQKQSDDVNDIVGTLPKCLGVKEPMIENRETYMDWVNKKKLKPGTKIILQPKYDGCSIALDCTTKKLFTRGDYDNGESVDVTNLFNQNEFVLSALKQYSDMSAMKFELIMDKDIHQTYFNRYIVPRDAVAAAMTSRSIESNDNRFSLIPLRLYKNGKQYVHIQNQQILDYDDYDSIQLYIDNLLSNNACTTFTFKDKTFTYNCDGVVASVILDKENDLYQVDPELEVAIKILDLKQDTKLLNVEFQFGKTGRITPVAILQPVIFNGKTIDHVTLSTLERVVNMNLKYNDTVSIAYNIVPYLISSNHDGDLPIVVPDKCPICHTKFNIGTLKMIKCTNPNCPGLRVGHIVRYCEKMKMFGISEGIINKLFDLGIIEDIPDLYRLTVDDISSIDGFGLKSANNIINSIKNASTDISLSRWFGAMPFDNIDNKTWNALLKNMIEYNKEYDNIYLMIQDLISKDSPSTFIEYMSCFNGFREAKYRAIVNGLFTYWDLLKETITFIKFKSEDKQLPKICLSGTRDKELINKLSNKYMVSDSLTKDCVLLIIPSNDFQSSKVNKAKEWNIPIITMDKF